MKNNWKDMNKSEKITYAIALICCCIGLVFAILDICKGWEYADLGWGISFGLYLAFEAKANWNKNRKMAILNLVLAVALIVVKIVTMFL